MENNIRRIIIDDQEIGVNPAMTVLQACEHINKEVKHKLEELSSQDLHQFLDHLL
jgi:hypothetical protein